MNELENVINGLECCSKGDCADCDNCTYRGVKTDVPCESTLMRNALALLKAQEVVVRCKDCIYWKSNLLTHFWKPCDVVSTDDNWYCPCGKRR